MLRICTFIFLLLLLNQQYMLGQHPMHWDEFVEYMTTNEEEIEQEEWIDYMEDLQQLHQHPININTATKEQLERLPFLSDFQVLQIIQYLDFHHGMYSLAELKLVPGISYQEQRILPLFLYVDENAKDNKRSIFDNNDKEKNYWQKAWQKASHEILSRIDVPLYHRRGYLIENGYRGSNIYNKVYYRFTSRNISASLRAERDPGERGMDHIGANMMFTDIPLLHVKKGGSSPLRLKSLVIGDFKVGFGLGLVLNQGFSMGKSLSHQRPTQGFRAHRSTEETNFMRGMGVSFAMKNITASLFYSHRQWDATLDSIPYPNNKTHLATVKTIVKNGYHRTETEYGKKNVLGINVLGGNLAWHKQGYHTGLSGYYAKTNKTLLPGTTPYRRIYPQGNHFGAFGIDYGYDGYRWQFVGEVAYGGTIFHHTEDDIILAQEKIKTGKEEIPALRNGVALLNRINWRISQRYTLSLLQRYYNSQYFSFFSCAMAENSTVQNETGGMLRMDAQPLDGILMAAYVDVFYNPWPRYGLTHSSGGWDGMFETQCTLSRTNSLKIRYNVKQKEQSSGKPIHHRLRLQWTATTASQHWSFKTTAMVHALKGSHGEAIGYSMKYGKATQSGSYYSRTIGKGSNRPKAKWDFSIGGLYFHTTDNDSRIYLYEPNVAEMMYIPSFSGHGIRGSGVLQFHLWDDLLRLELKYGVTRYFDRDTQGSELQTIYSPVKNDITLQLRVKI